MLIGVISDTHDNVHLIEKAVNIFNERKVNLVLHAGDFISPFVPRWFKGLNCKLIGVFGNNERERELLRKRLEKLGHEVRGYFAFLKLNDRKIALLHGHEHELLQALIRTNYFDLVVYGHTHKVDIRREGRTLVINPGEACGYLTGEATCATIDLTTLEVQIIKL